MKTVINVNESIKATGAAAWSDDLTTQTTTDNCIECNKPTNSHLILLAWVDGQDTFVPVADHGDADAYGHVCHSCYRDFSGDAELLAERYTEKVTTLCDQYDVPVSMLVENPSEVQDRMDADDWDKL